MNEQIKQRITQLNNGEVPSGYEKTEFGIFPCDWVKDKTFGDLFDFYGGLGKSREELGEEGHAYLHYGDLHRGSFNVVSHEQYEHLPKYDVTLKGSETYLILIILRLIILTVKSNQVIRKRLKSGFVTILTTYEKSN